ncbi:MAG: Rne/Rng family ribonuclease [Nitrospirae bacterium]|nr:Rne/Rng family ribonuclease [Nitrospirota bacterium]
MATEIVINTTREETRVAVLENRAVTELYIDRRKDQGIVGNVYKGRVVKVLPGMQAAFVDIGQERAAFLYVDDITVQTNDYARFLEETDDKPDGASRERAEEKTGKTADAPGAAEAVEAESPMTAAPPEEADDGEEPSGGEERAGREARETELRESERPKPRRSGSKSIEDMLQEGQEIMVQVTKEPMGTKGPRVTMYVSLPGRYLVLMPNVNHVGVSRRIGRDEERGRLKDLIYRLRKPGTGYIVRTVSEGMTEEEVRADMAFLDLVWKNILKKKEPGSAPLLLHNDLDLVFRTIRDLFTHKVDRLIVDSKPEYERIKEFVNTFMPDLSSRVELYDREESLFDNLEIELEISKALGRKVWLKSGGYIVIDHTEALTVIDVNTGRFVGRRHLEDTILKTNLEAVKEIAYQLRLRNIGGIIVIDFIDMERERNREKVYNLFQEALSKDRAKSRILRISELGLVEMSRERTREDLLRVMCEPCSYCEGRGYTKSPTTVCYELFREIRKVGTSPKNKKIIIGVHPDVANLLYDEERQSIDDLEREMHKKIIIKADSNLHIEQYDIVTL